MGPKKIRDENLCRICGSNARYSYVGVLVCPSCKMFFKRNAMKTENALKCHYESLCEITINTRHTCSSCRLKKCFKCGMQIELLRGHLSKKKKRRFAVTVKTNFSTSTSTSNLLEQNRFGLFIDQWNFNQINASMIDYLDQQKKLLVKRRFKIDSVQPFIHRLMSDIQILFQQNQHLLLFETNLQDLSTLISIFILFSSDLFHHETFHQTIISIYGEEFTANILLAVQQVNSDPILIKLLFSLLVVFPSELKSVNHCSDSVWRILIERFDCQRAVRFLSNLIRSLFALHRAILSINH